MKVKTFSMQNTPTTSAKTKEELYSEIEKWSVGKVILYPPSVTQSQSEHITQNINGSLSSITLFLYTITVFYEDAAKETPNVT